MFYKKATLYAILMWSVAGVLLSACSAPAAVVNTEEGAGKLAQIESAVVEVGLGSPTPVTVTVDVSFRNACSQISQVTQTLVQRDGKTIIQIEVRVADMGEICTEFPQSFRMVLPVNASGLPKGVYSVEVNGVDAGSFEFKN